MRETLDALIAYGLKRGLIQPGDPCADDGSA